MILPEADDPLFQDLRLLRPVAPDPRRAERVRARCRTRLARSRTPKRSGAFAAFAGRVLPPLLLGGVCAAYFASLVVIALRVHGLV